jgi:hypothetical protein
MAYLVNDFTPALPDLLASDMELIAAVNALSAAILIASLLPESTPLGLRKQLA